MPEVSPRQSPSALVAYALLLGGATAAIFVAGGAPQGNLGVFLMCAGAAMVACPPKVRVEGRLWAAAGGLVACSGLAFLPARWVAEPLWRKALASAPAIVLPGSITAAPGETAFWIGVLVLSLLTGLFALTQPVRARGMIWFALAAVLACAVYAGLAMFARATGWHYPFSGGATFGFLPNRNHSGTFLITGGVLAAGLMTVAFRDRRWLVADLAVAGGLTCAVALAFFSESRAGVLILLAGGLGWLAGLGRGHRSGRIVLVVAVAVVVAGGLFVSFKGQARDRVLELVGIRLDGGRKVAPTPTPAAVEAGAGSGTAVAAPKAAGSENANVPLDFRVSVYHDAWRMVCDQPWTGTGLGTFAGIFAQYRERSLEQLNALHPESDWLMLAAEAGLPACVFAAALVAMAAGRLRDAGVREHPYWPLRWAVAVAAGAALLHSVVDVPVHRAAVGWWMLTLAGLALQRKDEGRRMKDEGRGQKAEGRRQKAEGRRQEAEGGGQEAEGRRRRAEGGGQKAEVEGTGAGWQRGVFVLGGVGALVLGGMLVRAEWMHGPALPPFAVLQAPQRMFEAYERKDYAAGLELGRKTVRDSPLAGSVYYYLGIFLAVSDEEGVDQQVDEVFKAERVLDPVMTDVAHHQAAAWAGYDPVRQTAMMMDELARMGRTDQALHRGWQEDRGRYQDLMSATRVQPDVQRYLLAVTRPDQRFAELWKLGASPELLQGRSGVLEEDRVWTEQRKGEWWSDWYFQPESAAPVWPYRIEAGEPGWGESAWPVRLRQMVNAGQYQRAVGTLTARYGISLMWPGTAEPGVTAEADAWRQQAARAATDEKWEEAWVALEKYVRRTRQTEWP